MNLFCFTLEGSTESIYEPPYRQTLKDVLPSYQCSPSLHRRKPEWGGSDPAITSERSQSTAEVKRDYRRSCVPTSPSENETLDRDINYSCCMSSGDNKDFSHQMKETCKASRQSSELTRELNSDRTQTDLPAQAGETAADTTESLHTTGRLKKLQSLVQTKTGHQNLVQTKTGHQNLVQTKTGHQSGAGRRKRTSENHDHLTDVLRNNNPVLTCIGLGRRAEKKPSEAAASPQQQASDVQGESEEDGVWSPRLGNYLWNPFECPQPWTPFYHTCHQPQHKLSVCAGSPSPPRTSEWDRFESLIQELDSRQSDPSPPETIGSITDLQQLSQNTLTRFGRFEACRQPSPLMKPRDDGGAPKEQSRDPSNQRRKTETETETSPHRDRKHVEASPEKTLTAITSGNTQRDEAEKRRVGGGRSFSKGHRRSRNSLESLYSLNSGQSSSSGVTSGSGCSSNRDSLRLEDDLSYTRQLCGRAKVHTDFVPSPYDTESLKLKVGDVIDIIAKPPMGIWTGVLNGRMGNFKFIYVDVLTEETQSHRGRLKSTVQEVLKRLSMEEHLSSLQLNGYQTVEDLMRLREHHLTELNVTDPEHRHRLLAAVRSLQRLHTESQSENEANREAENTKAEMNNCPRDSGCHMPSDSPDSCPEDPDLPFISEYPRPAATAS